jgi:hypothetical protein
MLFQIMISTVYTQLGSSAFFLLVFFLQESTIFLIILYEIR